MPFPYRKILCAVAFDECSSDALREAAALALSGNSSLSVLHAVQINPLVDMGSAEGYAAGELYEDQTEFARESIEKMLKALPAELKPEIMIKIGEPGDAIIDAQAKLGADLIVIATHGRKGLKHLVLGSIAERVVRESSVPVLTVQPAPVSQSE
jgi:nucleotide-binding universal stress UspA family protein